MEGVVLLVLAVVTSALGTLLYDWIAGRSPRLTPLLRHRFTIVLAIALVFAAAYQVGCANGLAEGKEQSAPSVSQPASKSEVASQSPAVQPSAARITPTPTFSVFGVQGGAGMPMICPGTPVDVSGEVDSPTPQSESLFLLVKNPRPAPNPDVFYIQKEIRPFNSGQYSAGATGHFDGADYEIVVVRPTAAEALAWFRLWLGTEPAYGRSTLPRQIQWKPGTRFRVDSAHCLPGVPK